MSFMGSAIYMFILFVVYGIIMFYLGHYLGKIREKHSAEVRGMCMLMAFIRTMDQTGETWNRLNSMMQSFTTMPDDEKMSLFHAMDLES